MISIDDFLNQIDHDYNQSIIGLRQIMSTNNFSIVEKRLIAKKIITKLESMRTEMEVWLK